MIFAVDGDDMRLCRNNVANGASIEMTARPTCRATITMTVIKDKIKCLLTFELFKAL